VAPIVGVAALNTGNNSLYLLLALGLGAFAAAGIVSRHVLGHIRVAARCPGEVFAGGPAAVILRIANDSRWLPAQAVVCRLAGLPGRVLVPRVPRRGEVTCILTTVFPKRGRHKLPDVQVEVRLPLPFFVKRKRDVQGADVLVFPCRVPAGAIRLASVTQRAVDGGGGRGRRGVEVDHLREFRAGDDRRDIHWKQTARQQRLIVMERREQPLPSGFLVLDRQLPSAVDPVWERRFEDLICEVAAAARARIRTGGLVGLVIGGAVTAPGSGADHARRLLEQLALVKAVGPGEDPLPSSLRSGTVYRLAGRP
jgi:uncharacterized protein (DUF58 family)